VIGSIFSNRMIETFGPARAPRSELNHRHADLAASVQLVLEECYFALLNDIQRKIGLEKLCLAGGVALNCVANGMIFEKTSFRDLYIQPAAHDAGTSIGAALHVWHEVLGRPRRFVMRHAYYGAEYSDDAIEMDLRSSGVVCDRLTQRDL